MTEKLKPSKDRAAPSKSGSPAAAKTTLIPVTAIGASAGGLEPIEQFFDTMPADSGCAFVIIQHLSPDFKSLMDELLARHSTMKIIKIEDGLELERNCIYLNPPRSVMSITNNKMVVEELNTDDAVYLPIDLFFISLAQSRGKDAIGLVLSGTGSDGTKGSIAIKDAGGAVLVQDPATTRFDGMPRSALSEVSPTLIGTPTDLARSVQRVLNKEHIEQVEQDLRKPVPDPLMDVLSMLRYKHGTDFLQYKEATIKRRLDRRVQLLGIKTLNAYRELLATDTFELQELYADLLIEVTSFFRDPEAFAIIKRKVVPDLIQNLEGNGSLRVWVPGCASGEEAYSIAILLQEHARLEGVHVNLKIMATDIHIRSMNQASSGIYSESALENVDPDLIKRYFDCSEGQVQIKPKIRNMVFFSTHDVTRDPPFTKIDLIACRNLLIYLKEEVQEKVMNLLHFSLRKDGYLFLGPSEHIGGIAHEFNIVNDKWRIYQKHRDVKLLAIDSVFRGTNLQNTVAQLHSVTRFSPTTNTNDNTVPFRRAHKAALESIVERHAPAGFLLTTSGEVAHIFGDATELIPMKSGSFSKKIIDLITPELKVVINAALDHSKTTNFKEFQRTGYIKEDDAPSVVYNVTLTPLVLPSETENFLLLSVEKQKKPKNNTDQNNVAISTEEARLIDSSEMMQQRISLLEHNLQSSEESLQSTIEELEASNEELQSTNEELMSSNEELQSTNEELHSVNEELYTVSAEHQRKNEDLIERETDIDVLLHESKIGTLHLDEELCLRRYSTNARSVFNILPQDIGRPINHITVRSDELDINKLVRQVHTDEKTHESRLVINDEIYLLRIMPYKRDDTAANGILITVIDISDMEHVRGQLHTLDSQLNDIMENTHSFFVQWDAKTHEILYCNDAYAERWDSTPQLMTGTNILKLKNAEDQRAFFASVQKFKPGETRTGVFTNTDANGNLRSANIFTRAISADGVNIDSFQSNGIDCTELVNYNNTIERLVMLVTGDQHAHMSKLDQLLEVGLNYLDLDTALFSSVTGDKYEVKSVVGRNPDALRMGDIMNIDSTVCSTFIEDGTSISVDDLSNSELNGLPCHRATGIESFVGVSLHTINGPFGTISFSSKKARQKDFTDEEEHIAKLIASWIGFLIGNQEQLDFMTDQNEYYKDLYYSVPAMMFLSDENGLLLSASNRLCEKMGMDIDDVSGKNCYELFETSDTEAFRQAISNGDTEHLPLQFITEHGRQLEVELNSRIKPVGTLKGVRMVVLNDVSERNQAFRKTEDQNRQLASVNENLNQFAFIASHDLQEPLRKIQQFSSFLREDLEDKLSGDAKYHLDVVVDAAGRMSTLIYDLLRYSGASKEEPKIETIALNYLIEDVQTELDLLINEAKATINIGPLPEVQGDSALLRQLFVNLISNGIKYASTKRAPVISIKGFGKDNAEGVVVADNGIGIPREFTSKIFDPFVRLHSDKEYKGNGIGLAICSTVCEKHNWKIEVGEDTEVGSQFIITFDPK